MRPATRIVVWLTMLALPVHGFAAIAMDLRGPAHYHAESVQSGHGHEHVARHFHAIDEAGIEVDDDDHHHDRQTMDTGKQGASSGLDAVAPASARVFARCFADAIAADCARGPAPLVPARLERPPSSVATPLFP